MEINKKVENKMEIKKRNKTREMVLAGMFAGILAIMAQISIPTFTEVPITLQTFAIALTGVVLGTRLGFISTGIYVLIGAVGVPVFANLKGGLSALTGYTGGFIWGFLGMAILCGIGSSFMMKGKRRFGLFTIYGILFGTLGMLFCHILGVTWFGHVADMNWKDAAMLVSVPYLIKDIVSVIAAFLIGSELRRRLHREQLQ